MNEKADALKQRTKKFALDVLAFGRNLPGDDQARDIGRQLTRSATSVGANYRAACRSRSRAEFIARLGVVLEEADESAFWLEIVAESRVSSGKRVYELLDEANQLCAIVAASSITAGGSPKR
jgi:four helix bundle protein